MCSCLSSCSSSSNDDSISCFQSESPASTCREGNIPLPSHKRTVTCWHYTNKLSSGCQGLNFYLFLVASPVSDRHSRLSICRCSYRLHPPPSLQPLPCPFSLLSGLPRFIFPGCSILSILLPIYPSSFPRTSYMSKPPQSCLSCFLSKPSHLRCPLDLLIPDLVHYCQ